MASCKKCNKRHNTLLHFEPNTTGTVNSNNIEHNVESAIEGEESTNAAVASEVNTHATKKCSQVLLATALVKVQDSKGQETEIRALLDAGAQSNFCTEKLYNKLKLPKNHIKHAVSGVGKSHININYSVNIEIKSSYNLFKVNLPFLIINTITEKLPSSSFDTQELAIPENIQLADPSFNISRDVDILLGSQVFWQILRQGQLKLSNSQLTLQKTVLGWVVGGSSNMNFNKNVKSISCLTTNSTLDEQLQKFWNLEECQGHGNTPKKQQYLNESDLACEKHFLENHKRDTTGRFTGDLFNILIRYRTHKYVFTGDVSKMYRQINICPKERRFQRILWRPEPDMELKCYELATVSYGTASAAFLAVRCLHQLADENMSTYPEACHIIKNDFYMDDVLSGSDTTEKLIKLQRDIQNILASGAFEMRLVGPVIIVAKLIIQNLWKANIGWDDMVPADIYDKWQQFKNELINLNKLSISRYSLNSNAVRIELHDNPADLISRGCEVNALLCSNLWFHGPEWLAQDESEWPKNDLNLNLKEIPEQRVVANLSVNSRDFIVFDKFSKLTKLQRVIAYIFRFYNNSKASNGRVNGPLNANELQHALNVLIKLSQQESFPKEYQSLLKGTQINTTKSILNSRPLTPLSTDPNDLNPLTPAHLLIGRSLTSLPDLNYMDLPQNRLSMYNVNQQIIQHYWSRWHREYIAELQSRVKWKRNFQQLLKPDVLVIIKEDNQPPVTGN
ncbi:hypothetical protein NQ317_005385 [Molorchus minor]|uniref:DUF5641 domain-containing protein n=1 Tax=Molorchus minor TaxID=1323400 RepID=A0ABQ9ITI2_9CUCU|nr:hypothetical protein NQ317_005385 [Molorchus minor]